MPASAIHARTAPWLLFGFCPGAPMVSDAEYRTVADFLDKEARRVDGDLKMSHKKVVLVNAAEPTR